MRPEVLQFPALRAVTWLCHGFVCRLPGLAVDGTKAEALNKLEPHHLEACRRFGLEGMRWVTAEQIHGDAVACGEEVATIPVPGTDALICGRAGIGLGIYVADCAAVFLVDPIRRAIGLVHSGRKGTGLGVVPKTVGAMVSRYATDPSKLIAVIAPCIRPPRYEVDFAAEIAAQCAAAGVRQIEDGGLCTGADLARFYSYRMESGRTGRMLAFAGIMADVA